MSSRIEPYCSHFFAKALDKSSKMNRSLFEQTWTLCTPSDWITPTHAHIVAEKVLEGDRRIDIVIFDEDRSRVLGIEVKTTEDSVESGQLESYFRLLQDEYPDKDVTIGFVTPFNELSVKEVGMEADQAVRLPSVSEFHELRRFVPQDRAFHVSWLQIVKDTEWVEEPLWAQFVWFVANKIASLEELDRRMRTDQSLGRFFSHVAAEKFRIAMQDLAERNGLVDLRTLTNEPRKLQSFLEALTILIEDDQNVDHHKCKEDRFSDDRKKELVNSDDGRVHSEILKLSEKYDHVWIQGEKDYGLRVAHKNHPSSGVSILTSDTKNNRFKIKST